MVSIKIIIVAVILILAQADVVQLTEHNFYKTLSGSNWLFVNFYSPSCAHCKKLTPDFLKLSNKYTESGIVYGKLDVIAFESFSKKYRITSYPTLLLFHKSELPMLFGEQRTVEIMEKWLKEKINFELTAPEKQDYRPITYYGPKNDHYELFKVIALRDPYKYYRWVDTQELSYVRLDNDTITQIDSQLEIIIKKAHAGLRPFGEEPWVSVYRKKEKGILFINANQNKEILIHLDKLAKQYYDIMFFHIESDNPEYNEVLKYYTAWDQPSIFAINPLNGGLHLLQPPFKKEDITKFVNDFLEGKLKQYVKSQFSKDPNVLTAKNQNLIKQLKKDVVLFLYDQKQQISKNLIKLFKYLVAKLAVNTNLHLFRSNVSKNDLSLQIALEPLPKIVFFRHRMKGDPIYFEDEIISVESVINFMQENTTFDWPQANQL